MTAPTIQIVEADVLAMVPSMFDGLDSLITDFPYSPYVHANAVSADRGGVGYVRREFGFEGLTPELQVHAVRIMKRMRRWSIVFSDFESAHTWIAAATGRTIEGRALDYCRWVQNDEGVEALPTAWIRWSQPQKSGDRPTQGGESVLHFHREGGKHFSAPGNVISYDRKCLRGSDKHPTEKPLDLMLDLVSWYSDPGECVVDICAGAGTTALACRLLGRDCVAVERNRLEDGSRAPWIDVAKRRVMLTAWTPRDRDRAVEWCTTTHEKATAFLAQPRAKPVNGRHPDEKTRARAQRRLADVQRVAACL